MVTLEVLKATGGRRTMSARLPADALGDAPLPEGKVPVVLNGNDNDPVGYCALKRAGAGFELTGPLLVDALPTARRLACMADEQFPLKCVVLVRRDPSGVSVSSVSVATASGVGGAEMDVLSGVAAAGPEGRAARIAARLGISEDEACAVLADEKRLDALNAALAMGPVGPGFARAIARGQVSADVLASLERSVTWANT